MHDLLLRGGAVHDGRGSTASTADVAISGGLIVSVGSDLGRARREIECDGLHVAPGFIDAHAHSDAVPFLPEAQPFKLLQGVTTEIVGNCGLSAAPMSEAGLDWASSAWSALWAGTHPEPGSFSDYLKRVESAKPTNNIAALVGHGSLRLVANGLDEELSDASRERMAALATEAFEAGAVGVSSGLIYAPGAFATTDELVEVATIASRFGRIYTTHLRDEGRSLGQALEEAFEIGRRSAIPVQISHCKAAGRPSHGRGPELLETLRKARANGLDVAGDQYPYVAGSSFVTALLPPHALAGGVASLRGVLEDPKERRKLRLQAQRGELGDGFWSEVTPSGVLIVQHRHASFVGRTLDELAEGLDAWDVLCDLILQDPAALMVVDLMSEEDVQAIMRDPLISIGSDSGPPSGMQHPRTWGCFPRLLGTYVRELGVLSWEEAVRKATSANARRFGLENRGEITPGAIADLCVFEPARVGHAGTSLKPDLTPEGIAFVTLSGHVVVEDGKFIGDRLGTVLRAGVGA